MRKIEQFQLKNKRIMMISPKDNNFYNFRRELIRELISMENEVYLVCPYGSKIDYLIEDGCKFIDLNVDRRGTNPLSDILLIHSYRKILAEYHPDCVLLYTTKCSIYGGIACRLTKTKYIVNNAGLIDTKTYKWWLRYVLNILYRIGFGKASCMMYQNAQERDVVNKLLKNKVNYRDIPGSGVNLNQFGYEQYPSIDDPIVFNYVARVMQIKGIEEFLECAKQIHDKYINTRFVIYGDYDEDKYRKKVDDYQRCGIVEYGGILLDMKPAIIEAHAVIHPSYYEGMTNVVLEHSAMGRVCIGSDIPGVADGIEDGITGYTFECKNVDALVDKVEKFILLSNDEKASMGKAARKKMEQEFSREIVTGVYVEEIYKAVEEGVSK